MAMFEKEGYCPAGAFLQFRDTYEVSPLWKRTKEILGDCINYMVYTENGNSYKGGFIVDALEGGKETLGIEVATTLKIFFGIGKKKILCTDVINPSAISTGIIEEDGKWINIGMSAIPILLFEDSRYLVAIQNLDEHVRVHICKK